MQSCDYAFAAFFRLSTVYHEVHCSVPLVYLSQLTLQTNLK